MKLTLERMISNRSCTMGELTFEGSDVKLFTREDKRPTYDDNYIKHCLRPGVYRLNLEYGAIDIGNKTIRGYWPVFERVPWFPKASFCVAGVYGCRFGRINIGTSMTDEFTLDGAEDAIKIILKVCNEYMTPPETTDADGIGNTISTSSELVPLTLEIIESPDMEIHNYDSHQYYAQIEAERLKKEREELEKEIYGSPTPEGGALIDSI